MSGDDGTYKITVKSKVSVIILSSASCANEEVTVGNQREINTELRQSVKVLDDVVIVGYGTQKSRTITGSVAKIGSKKVATGIFYVYMCCSNPAR